MGFKSLISSKQVRRIAEAPQLARGLKNISYLNVLYGVSILRPKKTQNCREQRLW